MATNSENMEIENEMSPENYDIQEIKKLEITNEIMNQLNSASSWGKFLSIVGFVFIGFFIMIGLVMSIILAIVPNRGLDIFPFPPFLIGFIYVIISGIYFFPILYLFRFSTGIKKSLLKKDQNQLVKAFFNLKAHYRFIGIMMLAFFALYVIGLVVVIIVGLFSGLFSELSGIAVMPA